MLLHIALELYVCSYISGSIFVKETQEKCKIGHTNIAKTEQGTAAKRIGKHVFYYFGLHIFLLYRFCSSAIFLQFFLCPWFIFYCILFIIIKIYHVPWIIGLFSTYFISCGEWAWQNIILSLSLFLSLSLSSFFAWSPNYKAHLLVSLLRLQLLASSWCYLCNCLFLPEHSELVSNWLKISCCLFL